jgi:hypothetical protein
MPVRLERQTTNPQEIAAMIVFLHTFRTRSHQGPTFVGRWRIEKQEGDCADPPTGWNSWGSYGLRINEKEFRDNVEVLAAKLKPFGYSYAVIDQYDAKNAWTGERLHNEFTSPCDA